MVVLTRTHASGRRLTMTRKTPRAPFPIRRLLLDLFAAPMPPPEDVTRAAVVQLLARLLTSACRPEADCEGRDETR